MGVASPTDASEPEEAIGAEVAARETGMASRLPQPVTRIRPITGWVPLELGEVWRYRELLLSFCARDIQVRYKQTVLGAAWAIIQPVTTMVIFSLFFGRLANIPSDGVPYPIFSYTGLLPWGFFSNALTQASTSMVTSGELIKKVYFPRLLVPIASTLAGLVDLGIAFVVLLFMMAFYGIAPTPAVLLLPVFLLLALIAALGTGLWLSALNVTYRDVRYVLPFLTQIWLFATPIAYPSSLLSEPWRTLYGLNPMVGVVEGFRWALLGSNPPGPMLIVSSAMSLFLLASSAYYFRRMESSFADVV
jgi:lipopolysaccharide transport system permease protein